MLVFFIYLLLVTVNQWIVIANTMYAHSDAGVHAQ